MMIRTLLPRPWAWLVLAWAAILGLGSATAVTLAVLGPPPDAAPAVAQVAAASPALPSPIVAEPAPPAGAPPPAAGSPELSQKLDLPRLPPPVASPRVAAHGPVRVARASVRVAPRHRPMAPVIRVVARSRAAVHRAVARSHAHRSRVVTVRDTDEVVTEAAPETVMLPRLRPAPVPVWAAPPPGWRTAWAYPPPPWGY
jgi:hypothetical protein